MPTPTQSNLIPTLGYELCNRLDRDSQDEAGDRVGGQSLLRSSVVFVIYLDNPPLKNLTLLGSVLLLGRGIEQQYHPFCVVIRITSWAHSRTTERSARHGDEKVRGQVVSVV